ncbi:MAG: DNA integrity scanning diadenylate cyclase DisA, partial [Coriobacteriales bacterium]
GEKITLEDIDVVLAKANQALQTLERYRTRLEEVAAHLTMLELEDVVTLEDVAIVIQRAEMVSRVARDVGRYIVQLGTDGRLVRMQAEELIAGVEDDYLMLIRDYSRNATARKASAIRQKIGSMSPEQLRDSTAIAHTLGYVVTADLSEQVVHPAGYRLLRHIPMLPTTVINRVIERFQTLSALLGASEEQLDEVDGVGARRARAIIEGLRRMREHAAL